MKNCLATGLRGSMIAVLSSMGVLVMSCASPHSEAADNGPIIVRVEEDWELVVDTPVADSAAPQVTCTFSPVSHVDGLHATLEINHQSLPYFQAGGLHLQLWQGENALNSNKSPHDAMMSQAHETVCWTQRMEIQNGVVTFEVVEGSSTTWGKFGGQGYLKTSALTGLANLNDYSHEVSAKHSGVGYAGNRVSSLALKRIRVYTESGDKFECTTPLNVHSLSK